MTTSEHSEPGQPLAVPLSDQLGLVVDATVLDCWKANYGLEKAPAEIAAAWGNWAPSGAILALRAAVAEINRLRFELGYAQGQINQAEADQAKAVAAERERCITAVFAWAHESIDRHAGATFSAPAAAEQIVKRL